MEKIYVIGHKNPDVDSVISGILMQKLLEKNGYEAEFIIPDKYLDTETYNLLQKYDIDMNDYRKDFVIGATYFLVDHAHRNINGKMTQIICDEEGKLKQHQYISAVSEEHNETLVGNLIIKSTDHEIANIIDKYGVLVYSTRR